MQTGLFQSIDEELYNLIQGFAERRKWHLKYAKFNWRAHQSLLTHSLNVASLSSSILDFLEKKEFIKVDEKLHLQMILTGFLHDSGKESELFQKAVETFLLGDGQEPLDFGHQQEKEIRTVTESLVNDINGRLSTSTNLKDILDEVVWSVSQLGQREDSAAISQGFKKSPSRDAVICKEIVHFADILSSKITVEDAAATPLSGSITSKLSLVYSKVSTVRGVLTHFLHMAIDEQFEEKGFVAIQWFPEGTVYVGTMSSDNPVIDESRLIESIKMKMRDILNKNHSRQMAKAAFGGLTQQVIAAPEFLFADDETVGLFWQFISKQKFAKPTIKSMKELSESEAKVFKLLSDELKNEEESTRLMYLARFVADFNMFIVLYAARKQLIENVPNNKRDVEFEITQKIKEILFQILRFPMESMDGWPEIALQTKIEKRLCVALSFWQSPYYDNSEIWRGKLIEALKKATIEIARMWQNLVPDKYAKISNLLITDITGPISPRAMINEVEMLNSVIAEGKSGHGTPTCQGCGGVACLEAQAKLFGTSEIYHDHLIAGVRIGGGNKLQVCELCEFEEKLRSMFLEGRTGTGNSFYVFPQLSLSRRRQVEWQLTINRIEYNHGEFPSLLRMRQWAETVINNTPLSFLSKSQQTSYFSENDFARAIQYVADTDGLENDLSPMIEPGLDAENGKAVAALLQQEKCKLKKDYECDVYKSLNQLEPIYLSPNFILILTRGTVAEKEEPESSAEIKWTLFRSLLARLFCATVIPENFKISEKASLGYTPISSSLNLKTMAEKLNARKGWIDIPDLERSIRKLSALLLIAHELSNVKADYGRSTLLRLLKEEPGRVLYRLTSKSAEAPLKKLINLLNIWYYEK
jgi:hypothetical protein